MVPCYHGAPRTQRRVTTTLTGNNPLRVGIWPEESAEHNLQFGALHPEMAILESFDGGVSRGTKEWVDAEKGRCLDTSHRPDRLTEKRGR